MRVSLPDPEHWTPISQFELKPGTYSYMTCHWTDVERGIVVPKHNGQIFYFADLYEMWVYVEPKTEPDRERWGWVNWLILVLFLLFFGVDLYLVWVLGQRVEWF